jgi:hypothetical protein
MAVVVGAEEAALALDDAVPVLFDWPAPARTVEQ